MVYRAERLYAAKGDAEKIFKHVAQHLYDTPKFKDVFSSLQQNVIKDGDNVDKFITKREHLIRRMMSQVNTFLG